MGDKRNLDTGVFICGNPGPIAKIPNEIGVAYVPLELSGGFDSESNFF